MKMQADIEQPVLRVAKKCNFGQPCRKVCQVYLLYVCLLASTSGFKVLPRLSAGRILIC